MDSVVELSTTRAVQAGGDSVAQSWASSAERARLLADVDALRGGAPRRDLGPPRGMTALQGGAAGQDARAEVATGQTIDWSTPAAVPGATPADCKQS